ncbi:MAG: insulinase family protein [Anaerolineae bacterium]|nr:insulinase family protein [Anaerolineae bacterium]
MANFTLVEGRSILELNLQAKLYRHNRLGAQVLSLEGDDDNKVFGVTFTTPPVTSNGIAHIMEHSVLCGSQKYPVKEPFVVLLKSSLKTFLNALTFPDKTAYPVASQNLRDFYNLIDVYLDAVFHPLITPYTLKQEGWHYELDNVDAPLSIKGVVYNEMKGAYSSPDRVLYKSVQSSLFPDTTYGVDSGGDPNVIPELTFEEFKRFHETYYHPSNALFFFYGDDDPAERLRIIEDCIRDYEPLPAQPPIPLQPPFNQPKRLVYGYDAGQDSDGKKGMATVNWVLGHNFDMTTRLSLEILEHMLIGGPASPLRKALIDSGLGEDLAGAGLADDMLQPYFSTGLKGIASQDADKVADLVTGTLASLAEHGFDSDTMEAALNTIEFRRRENNTGGMPRGLMLMFRALSTWVYGGDPAQPLAFEVPLNEIKARIQTDTRYFENLIATYFLNNPHRTTVILEPDPNLRQRQDEALQARLQQARSGMNEADLQAIVADTQKLKQMQNMPDSPEALATIPTLQLSDLDKRAQTIPLDVTRSSGSQVLYHDLFTNGIVYLDLGLNLSSLPQDLLPYVTLFGRALLEMGTATESYVKLLQRIERKTGGIRTTTFASTNRDTNATTAWLFVRGKATVDKTDDLLAILRDVLLTVRLDDRERFRQIVLEEKASQEAALVPAGNAIANQRLRAHLSEAGWVNEQFGGISYLLFLRQLVEAIDTDWPGVQQKLETIRRLLVNRNALLCNVTLDAQHYSPFQGALHTFLAELPAAPAESVKWTPGSFPPNEGLSIPAQVNYVVKGADLYKAGYRMDGSVLVVLHHLRTTWLWDKVRVEGGAYGGSCQFDERSGIFSFASYRDPNLIGTLNVYDETVSFLRDTDFNPPDITRSIIGTVGGLDAYQLPDAKGFTSMIRHLTGLTDEVRQRWRDQVLATTMEDFRDFADVLQTVNEQGQVVVIGSQAALDKANAERENWLHISKVL